MEAKDLNFYDSPLKNYIHKAEIKENCDLNLADALLKKYNLTRTYLKDLEFRMMKNKNFLIEIYGDTGSGKSNIAQYTGSYVQNFIDSSEYLAPLLDKVVDEHGRKPVFDATNVCFDTSEMISRIKECVPFETMVYDESGSEKTVGTGSLREKADKERILKRVRSDQNNFIFCDPLTDDTKISNLYNYRLRTFDIDYEHCLNRCLIEAKNIYGIWNILGHIITSECELKGYREKKNEQIKAIKNFEFGGGRIKLWESLAEEMIKKGIGDFKFQDWFFMVDEWTKQNYTKQEVTNITKKIRFKLARPKENKKASK